MKSNKNEAEDIVYDYDNPDNSIQDEQDEKVLPGRCTRYAGHILASLQSALQNLTELRSRPTDKG